jgi:uncharacterized membrane protein YqiK
MLGSEQFLLIAGGLFVAYLFLFGWAVVRLFHKCGPNEALIISGLGAGDSRRLSKIVFGAGYDEKFSKTEFGAGEGANNFQIVTGGGSVVIPLLQQCNRINLTVMNIEVQPQSPMTTKDGVPIFVEGVARVKVKRDFDSIATYAENFLGKGDAEIKSIIHDRLIDHLRAVFGTMTDEELSQNADSFAQRVLEMSLADFAKMGLTIDSFTIKETKAVGENQDAKAKQPAAEETNQNSDDSRKSINDALRGMFR